MLIQDVLFFGDTMDIQFDKTQNRKVSTDAGMSVRFLTVGILTYPRNNHSQVHGSLTLLSDSSLRVCWMAVR
jgi:hypothetical protein